AVDEQQLEEARQKIIDVYQGQGFTDVSVQFRVDPIDEKRGTARVVYTVNEGVRGAVKQVQFEGNAHFSEKVLRKQMKTRGRSLIYFVDKTGRLDEVQLEQDMDKLREFYQDHGYIDVEIKTPHRERTEKGPMIITIPIVEGPQYHVRKLTITGYQNTTEDRIRKLLKMKESSVYSPKQLRDDAKAVADAYGSGGYVDLVVLPEGEPAGPAQIDVHYKIEEGVRSFVNRINIEGNTRTKDKVIRREVLVAPGDVFNTVRVDVTKKRLDNLGYFAKVETYPEETNIPSAITGSWSRCGNRSMLTCTPLWDIRYRTLKFLMCLPAHLTPSSRKRARLSKARFLPALCLIRAITLCLPAVANGSPFHRLLPVVFSEVTSGFTEWIWKGPNISICRGTPFC